MSVPEDATPPQAGSACWSPASREPFEEDEWVEGRLTVGEESGAAVVSITNRDERCSMVNFDPDSAATNPELLKAIVRERGNKAGAYGATARRGRLAVGQPIFFEPAHRQRSS